MLPGRPSLRWNTGSGLARQPAAFDPPLGAGIRASISNVGYFPAYGALTVYSDGGTPPTGWQWDGGTPNVLLSNTNGAILNLAQVNGQLFINHTGVVVTKCIINGGQITNISTGTLQVVDTTVIGPDNVADPGLRSDGTLNASRCHVTKTGDGIHWIGNGNTINQCYVGDQAFHDEAQHCDGMQHFIDTVDNSFTVQHCYIAETRSDMGTPMSSSITMGPPVNTPPTVYTPTLNNNYFASGLTHVRFNFMARNLVFTNNDFGPIDFGAGETDYHDHGVDVNMTIAAWSNNRDENGNPVNP